MKLLLTSNGFENPVIGQRFLGLIPKQPADIRILLIPTASRTEEELTYVRKSEAELLNLGIAKENIVWLDIENISAIGALDQYDTIYVCGGNTFYLMQRLSDTKLGNMITEAVKKGTTYVGVSAGSIVAGPDISIASPFDNNNANLQSMTGLGLTSKVISPHYHDHEAPIIEPYRQLPFEIIPLPDNQAYVEIDGQGLILN